MTPKYEFHISGQARVRFCGVDYYLGKFDSPESHAKYHALLAEYLSNGQQPPKVPDSDTGAIGKKDDSKVHLGNKPVTIRDLTASFRARVLPKYDKTQSHYNSYSRLCDLLDRWYGDESPNEFGPRKLETMRDKFVADGLSRRTVNDRTRQVVRIFLLGVKRELVKPDRITALESLEPLEFGECREGKGRPKVTLDQINATLAFLRPQVADMVRLQLATAMRPSELFRMTPGQIDRSGPTWFYRPTVHKTAHRKKTRAIPLSPAALGILQKYLFVDDDTLIFITSKGNPWKRDSYRRAVTRAAEKARVDHWTPYCLRHAAAQFVRDAIGAEATQAVLGHSRLDTTEIYSSASEVLAAKAASVIPAVG
jgi:integrase